MEVMVVKEPSTTHKQQRLDRQEVVAVVGPVVIMEMDLPVGVAFLEQATTADVVVLLQLLGSLEGQEPMEPLAL